MSKKYDLLTFEDFFMNFLLELKFLILSHPVTSKQPLKIVQILLVHPVLRRSLVWEKIKYIKAVLHCTSQGNKPILDFDILTK
jgi:hypothetical protein